MSTNRTAPKAELRRLFRERRRAALDGGRSRIEAAVLGAAETLLQDLAAAGPLDPVGLYWPLEGELDLRPLARLTAAALPAISTRELVYRPWQPGQLLTADACGIPAPPPEAGELAPGQLSLLLIPALAIDPSGFRLGYGGGWYDRLRASPSWRRPLALAVLPAACCEAELPRDPWDVPLDGWICETGLRWCGGPPDRSRQA
jgi:5-formyltetrahydrofolate cyclo-ligase